MTRWVALLRAVNVGGTGKMEMAKLRDVTEKAGFGHVRSYIASGNLVFNASSDERGVRTALEGEIARAFGACPDILLRAGAEMAAVAQRNPFPDAAGNQVLVLFTDGVPSGDGLLHRNDEEVVAGERELFIHFPSGMGHSRLVIPSSAKSTGRNMNTVRKLAAMAAACV